MRKQLQCRRPIRPPIRLHDSLKYLQMLLPTTIAVESGDCRNRKTAPRFDDAHIRTSRP